MKASARFESGRRHMFKSRKLRNFDVGYIGGFIGALIGLSIFIQ